MPRKLNLRGQTFNSLKVVEESPQRDRRGGVMWICECECGNTTLASSADLRSGHKKSCGCLQKEAAAKTGKNNLVDLTGKIFDMLEVEGKDHVQKTPNGSTKVYWKCHCQCGNSTIVDGNSLKSGNTKSCGCVKSFGEQKVAKLLRNAEIPFEKEKIFDNAKNFRFDFFVDGRYIIEYDGKQHYQDSKWGSTLKTKEEQQHQDQLKTQYCQENQIPIIRIPYTQYQDLTLSDLLLETSNFII